MLLAVLVIQEELLVAIPQVQLTVVLIVVYARFLPYKKLMPIILGYVIIDNLVMGSFSPLYTPAMFFSWMLLAVVGRAIRNKPDYVAFIWVVLFGFIYGWSFIPANMIMQDYFDFWLYLKIDLPWEIAMAANGVITFLSFYYLLSELFRKLFKYQNNEIDIDTFES